MDYTLSEAKLNAEFMQKILRSNLLLYFVILLLVLKIVTVFVSVNFPQNIFFADITKSALQFFVNQTRQSVGLKPLAENAKLNEAARLKAENMVQNQYFAHTSPNGLSPWYWFLQAGYHYKYAGENLAIGFFDSQEVYQAWLNSPEHKANIVNPNYTDFGTAVLNGYGNNNTIVVVQEFGSPLPGPKGTPPVAAAQPKVNPAVETTKPAPAPSPAASTQTQTSDTSEKVLSKETEAPVIKSPGNSINNLYNYEGLLQDVIYGVSLVVIGILLALIFFSFDIKFEKHLVLRAVLIVILLSAATLIDKEIIVSLIPHQVLI